MLSIAEDALIVIRQYSVVGGEVMLHRKVTFAKSSRGEKMNTPYPPLFPSSSPSDGQFHLIFGIREHC
jgi:hypothetical protein